MWKMRYDNYSDQGDGFYTMSTLPNDDKNSDSMTYVVSWTDPVFRPTSSNFVNVTDTEVRVNDVTLNDVRDDETDAAYSWINVEDTAHLPGIKSVPIPDIHQNVYSTFSNDQMQIISSRSHKSKMTKGTKDSNIQRNIDMNLIYGHHGSIFLACLVRLLLIGHNVFAVWRVAKEYNEYMYWLLAVTNFFLVFEGIVVVIRNAGKEYTWWSPCLLVYLAGTVPAVWFLQLDKYDTALNTSQIQQSKPSLDIWDILTAETLVFVLLFSRWLLPRYKLSENVIADILVEFFVIASDVMEFLAVFDNDGIRGDLNMTYVILAVWSASLIQFVTVFMRKNRYRNDHSDGWLRQCGGENAVKIIGICMSVFLQDLPFLVVRLYIVIEMEIITYSLIFFILKNIVTLLVLFSRLAGILVCPNYNTKSD